MEVLRNFVVTKYHCEYARDKVLNFAKAFLKYLTKTHLDTRYQAFEIFLQKPKALKVLFRYHSKDRMPAMT